MFNYKSITALILYTTVLLFLFGSCINDGRTAYEKGKKAKGYTGKKREGSKKYAFGREIYTYSSDKELSKKKYKSDRAKSSVTTENFQKKGKSAYDRGKKETVISRYDYLRPGITSYSGDKLIVFEDKTWIGDGSKNESTAGIPISECKYKTKEELGLWAYNNNLLNLQEQCGKLVCFKNEETTTTESDQNDIYVTPSAVAKVKKLAELVNNEWDGKYKLRVTEAFDEECEHAKKSKTKMSSHYTGHGVDFTLWFEPGRSKQDSKQYMERLGGLAIEAGFDAVAFEKIILNNGNPVRHIHASTK